MFRDFLKINHGLSNAFSNTVAIDLGSYQTRLMLSTQTQPVVVPSYLVQNKEADRLLSIGQTALEIVGRSGAKLEIIRPIREGNFTDYQYAKVFLEHCFSLLKSKGQKRGVSLPQTVYFFVSSQMNEVQHRALLRIAQEIGIAHTHLLVRPLIAALTKHAQPSLQAIQPLQLLIDCGYESTIFSVLQFGKVLRHHQAWYGGKDLTKAMIRFLRTAHHLEIGSQAAERLKQECAAVLITTDALKRKEYFVVVRGRDVMSGLPKTHRLSAFEFESLFVQFVQTVMDQLAWVIDELGPELMEELILKGFMVFGGMAIIDQLISTIESQYGTVVFRPAQPDVLYHQGFLLFQQLSHSEQREFYFSL